MHSGAVGGLATVHEEYGQGSPAASHVLDTPSAPPTRRRLHLRMILLLVDATILVAGWWVAQLVTADVVTLWSLATGAVVVVLGAGVLSAVGLYRRRICSVRRSEVVRLGAAVLLLAPPTLLMGAGRGWGPAATAAATACTVWFAGLVLARGTMREWIKGRRASGDFAAPVVVVAGSGEALARIAHFVSSHAVLGYEVRGLVGPEQGAGPDAPAWLGDLPGIVDHVGRVGASGAVLDGGSLTGDQLNDLTMRLSDAAFHVHVSTGLAGVDARHHVADGGRDLPARGADVAEPGADACG